MSIEDIKTELKKRRDKVGYLKRQLQKEPINKSEIRALLINEIKSARLVKSPVQKKEIQYRLVYDSIGETLEPIYFWLLDFMRDKYQGLGLEVSKTADDYEASVGGAFFTDMGTRMTRMQEQARNMLGTINTVVRSIINLIYDLKEFEIRLDNYDNLNSKDSTIKETAMLGLKQVWMDNVDIRRGRGSLNQLAQALQFVTIRDAFLAAKNAKDVDKMDLNERVKRILKPRIQEFEKWIERSGTELRKRYNIERAYLRSQVGALKMYATWTKPYLKAAQKLSMREFLTQSGEPSPDIVHAFSNTVMELVLFGRKSVGKAGNVEYFSCVETTIRYRTLPQTAQFRGQQQFVHSGRAEIEFKGFAVTSEDLEYLKKQELYEGLDLIEEMVDTPLEEMKQDIEHFLAGIKDEKLKDEIQEPNPFKSLIGGFNELFGSLKGPSIKEPGFKSSYKSQALLDKAKTQCRDDTFVLYDVYKKTHGMITW